MNLDWLDKEKTMTSNENKEIVRYAFEEISRGNHQAFLDSITEDFSVTLIGSTPFSNTLTGIKEVTDQMIVPVMSALETQPKIIIDKLIAEGDNVVLVAHGEGGVAKNGKPYNNSYCHVMRLKDGKIAESTEYCDTALINETLAKSLQ